MIPEKLTPDERRARWADYRGRRNLARLSVLLVAASIFGLRKWYAPQLAEMPTLSRTAYAAITVVFVGTVVTVVGIPLSWWMKWKCPHCGNKFVLNSFADRGF